MSRIGKLPVSIPSGVTVTFVDRTVTVRGPKGELVWNFPEGIVFQQEENTINVTVVSAEYKNFRGLGRTLINNMVEGVTKGFEKRLQVLGVGYNVKVQGQKLHLNLGFSHPVEHALPKGITALLEKDPK